MLFRSAENRVASDRAAAEAKLAALAKRDKDQQEFWKAVEEERKYIADIKEKKLTKVLTAAATLRGELIASDDKFLAQQQEKIFCRQRSANAAPGVGAGFH